MQAFQKTNSGTPPQRMVEFTGTIESLLFRDEESGYTVLSLSVDARYIGRMGIPKSGKVCCVGSLLEAHPGLRLRLKGSFVPDAHYGRHFLFKSMELVVPPAGLALEVFLSSGVIQGIDAGLARRMVALFGRDTFSIFESDPDAMLEVEGMTEERLFKAKSSWKAYKGTQSVLSGLQAYGIDAERCMHIFKAYGGRALEVVRGNPYRLVMEIDGIGFEIADKIASDIGIATNDSLRLKAGLLHVLQKGNGNGDVFLYEDTLLGWTISLLEDVRQGELRVALQELAKEGHIVREEIPGAPGQSPDYAIYLTSYYKYETKTAEALLMLAQTPSKWKEDELLGRMQEIFDNPPFPALPDGSKFQFDELQQGALLLAAKSKVMVLTGGPGTGKTTIIKAIIALFEELGGAIVLAAPTGRAAKRMSEATGHGAKTLHRLLEYSPGDKSFTRNAARPLDCDVIIVDEASMMDAQIFYHLLMAIPPRAAVFFVGDIHQLPSVGAGCVLADLIGSHVLPVAQLHKIFRQGADSQIVSYAHEINEGVVPNFDDPSRDWQHSDFFFMLRSDPSEAAKTIVNLVKTRLPLYYGTSLDEIQVLSPMHDGETGTSNMNSLLQDALNPKGFEINRKGMRFRVGDKVMQIKNNYDKNVFNGDMGIILDINLETKEAKVAYEEGKDVAYDFSELDEIVLAYAISIHKSQGSEYKAVIVPIMSQHSVMLQRNLLYTAITRGKKLVVLVGEREAFEQAVANNKSRRRNTRLAFRLAQGKRRLV